MTTTEVQYMYRNEATSVRGTFWLHGGITQQQREEVRVALVQGQYFVPEQVGVPNLAKGSPECPQFPTNTDHAWHSLFVDSIGTGEANLGRPLPTVESFVTAMAEAKSTGWDAERFGPHRKG